MGFLKKLFGRKSEVEPEAAAPPPRRSQITIPEVTVEEFKSEWQSADPPLLLDCREGFEWRQGHVPGSIHMPMNQIPARVEKFNKAQEIVVICATGNRSYSVAGFFIQNGFKARSLQGGITAWQWQGGEVVQDG